MKLPINFLLYVSSLGLLGLAGWTFYEANQEGSWGNRDKIYKDGIKEAIDKVAAGHAQGPTTGRFVYRSDTWMNSWMSPNILGVDPPKPTEDDPGPTEKVAQPVDMTPLEEIIELVTIMRDGEQGLSHVTVRYLDNVEVHPPAWWELENQPPASGGAGFRGPADRAGPTAGVGRQLPSRQGRAGSRPNRPPPPPTSMPTSSAGRQYLQRVWVRGDGTPRFEATLWPPYAHIRIVRVAEDGRSAFFTRTAPAAAGEPPVEPVEEELIQSSLPLSQEVLRALREIDPEAGRLQAEAQAAAAPESLWQDVEETTRIEGVWHIGRKESRSFDDGGSSLLEQINVDSYRSRTGSGMTGLRVMNVSPEIRSRFGVQQGDLILAINGVPVKTKAEAINIGKKMYKRGVRKFDVTFITSEGIEEVRTYIAPEQN